MQTLREGGGQILAGVGLRKSIEVDVNNGEIYEG